MLGNRRPISCRMLKRIRSLTRFAVALIVWAHAIFLFELPHAALAPLFKRLHTSEGEATVLALIAGFSILASYGWGKVIVDLIYIYFFPFICLWHIARLMVRAASALNTLVAPTEAGELSEPPPYYVQIPGPILVATTPKAAQPVLESDSVGRVDDSFWDKVARHTLRPFRQFTLLWGLLLIFTIHRWLLDAALIVVSVQLLAFLVGILALSFTSHGWFSELSQNFQGEMEKLIDKITQAKHLGVTQEVRNAWASLRYFLIGANFLRDRRRVAQWTVFFGVIVFGVIYLYLAVLFSFEYYGIARWQGIAFDWRDALITSVFLPIYHSDLPHTRLLRLTGGIQWAGLVALGTSTAISVFREKLKPLFVVANTITRKMEEDEVKTTLIVIKDELDSAPSAAWTGPQIVIRIVKHRGVRGCRRRHTSQLLYLATKTELQNVRLCVAGAEFPCLKEENSLNTNGTTFDANCAEATASSCTVLSEVSAATPTPAACKISCVAATWSLPYCSISGAAACAIFAPVSILESTVAKSMVLSFSSNC